MKHLKFISFIIFSLLFISNCASSNRIEKNEFKKGSYKKIFINNLTIDFPKYNRINVRQMLLDSTERVEFFDLPEVKLFKVKKSVNYRINVKMQDVTPIWKECIAYANLAIAFASFSLFPAWVYGDFAGEVTVFEGENKISEHKGEYSNLTMLYFFYLDRKTDYTGLQKPIEEAYDSLLPVYQKEVGAITANYKFVSNGNIRQQIAKNACSRYQKYLEEDKKINYTTKVSVNAKLSDETIIKDLDEERPIKYTAECNFTFTDAGSSVSKTEVLPVACRNETADPDSDCYSITPRTEKEIQTSNEREKERRQADKEREQNRKAVDKCKKQCALDWTQSTSGSCNSFNEKYNQCKACQNNCE